MYCEILGRHFSGSSLLGAQELSEPDKNGFWNVISILSLHSGKPALQGAKNLVFISTKDFPA